MFGRRKKVEQTTIVSRIHTTSPRQGEIVERVEPYTVALESRSEIYERANRIFLRSRSKRLRRSYGII